MYMNLLLEKGQLHLIFLVNFQQVSNPINIFYALYASDTSTDNDVIGLSALLPRGWKAIQIKLLGCITGRILLLGEKVLMIDNNKRV